jgi:hypothetical protein
MSNVEDSILSSTPAQWRGAARLLLSTPSSSVECPVCHATSVSAGWHLVDLSSRTALVDLNCSSCGATANFQTILPLDARGFYPLERMRKLGEAVKDQLGSIAKHVQQHAKTMPAAAFTTHPLWAEAKWNATTFQWHPTSEAPPIMGLVFENSEAGLEIFREAERQMNHEDRFEEIRVSIIEGPVSGQERRPGYSVHISPDPEALAMHATGADFVVDQSVIPFLGQWNRHYPIPGMPALLPRFKTEFAKHNEFLLAPVVRRSDGQLYAEPLLGIIKNLISFRCLSEITPNDPDAAALVLPQLITPPV